VDGALQVSSQQEYHTWKQKAERATAAARQQLPQWQQFVVHARGERGDPIRDYHVELFTTDVEGNRHTLEDFDLDEYAYSKDKSYRCYHVDIRELQKYDGPLGVRVIASSGSQLVGYHGVGSERLPNPEGKVQPDAVWDAIIPLPSLDDTTGTRFFFPFTTTFVELKLNRDPMPFDKDKNKVCWFGEEEDE
jgi:hypothetical protein